MAFQNPAQNYAEKRLNLGDMVSLSPHSTYLMRSAGDYPEAGILEGALLAIDRSLTPRHGNIIIAEVDDELVLRRLLLTPSPALQALTGVGELTPLNADFAPSVWGVVSYAVNDLAGQGFSPDTDAD